MQVGARNKSSVRYVDSNSYYLRVTVSNFRSKPSWSLRAEPGQRLHLRFLDISLRERTSDGALECLDSVEVKERGKRLMRMCGESQADITLLSERNVLEVTSKKVGNGTHRPAAKRNNL